MPLILEQLGRGLTDRCTTMSRRLRVLHRDQDGTISVLSVIVLVMLTMLLGMILNVGEQIDDKIALQNAADAASYSSGVVVARGMNSIAFTNHLLSETFALTAYFREGRDRYAESLVPEVLDAWEVVGQQLARADFQLFRDMQPAISPKVQMEREVVKTFSDMTEIKARLLLPAFHTILGFPENTGAVISSADQQRQIAATHLIPVFQRAVVQAVPVAAVGITQEITRRNVPTRKSGAAQSVLWSSQTFPLQGVDQADPYQRLLPAIDPTFEGPDFVYLNPGEAGQYQAQAVARRNNLAFHYLREWIDDWDWDLAPFEREGRYSRQMPDEYLPNYLGTGGMISAKMSQFKNMYRGFCCAKLNILLHQEFPTTNLPHMLRNKPAAMTQQQFLDNEYTYTTAIYRKQRPQTMPGMYRPLMQGDALSFARVSLYVPRTRYITWPGRPRYYCDRGYQNGVMTYGTPCFDHWPQEWSLFNQHWAAKMLPTSAEDTVALLQTNPQQYAPGVNLPDLSGIQVQDLKAINTH